MSNWRENMTEKLINFIDIAVSKFWFIFCAIILLGAFFIKAQYDFADFPYFTWNYSYDIFLFVCVLCGYLFLFKNRELIQKKIPYPALFAVFGLIGVVYVFLVPIKPFSDMSYVTEGALYFASGDLEGVLVSKYLQLISKNLKVSMFYGFFGLLLPKSLFSFRIINVILYLLISYFMGEIAKNYKFRYSKLVFILTATFVPLLLYCNHVYYDLPVLCMCTIAVYFYTKNKDVRSMIFAGIALGIGCSLRVLAYLFLIAMTMDYVFKFKKELLLQKGKKVLVLLSFVFLVCAIPKGCTALVNTSFRVEGAKDSSIWGLFWMGINEEEFGFMHNEILGGGTSFEDFYNLLVSRDVKQNLNLFGRKIFWEWSQGTYQAQRYAFGSDAMEYTQKFEYETPLTRYLLYDGQKGRQCMNSFMHAQYMCMFFLMTIALGRLKKNDRENYRMFLYLMFGTFLILFFYEMKSRYVLHCFIPMLLLALKGLSYTEDQFESMIEVKKVS